MTLSHFINRLCGNNNSSTSKAKRQRSRVLRFEELEGREMLSVTIAEFDAIREQYADLDLSTNMAHYNVIEIIANELTDTKLRSAIAEAGTTVYDDLIVIRTTVAKNTISLGGTAMEINVNDATRGSVTIVSLGNVPLTIDARQQSRVLNIGSDANVALAGLIITRGVAYSDGFTADSGRGGGILNRGALTVTNCTITGNTVTSAGGGICNVPTNYNNTLTVTSCTITENSGTGIYSRYSMTTIANCTITGNSGCGISTEGSKNSSVTNCTISGNSNSGIYSSRYTEMTVTNCTISGNKLIITKVMGSTLTTYCTYCSYPSFDCACCYDCDLCPDCPPPPCPCEWCMND